MRLAFVKTLEAPLSESGLKSNLKKAISQIKAQALKTHETGGYIRIDASTAPSTTLTPSEIGRFVKGQLVEPKQKGIDYVEFVEVLDKDAAGQNQKLLFRVQSGNTIISSFLRLTMQSKPLDKTAAPIEPLNDTWGTRGSGDNYWAITSPFDFTNISTQQVNAWFAKTVVETLLSFSDLARLWEASFGSLYRDDVEPARLEWKPGDSYEEYIENVFQAIREYPAPIYNLEMKVDLFVYVRIKESPDKPIKAWVRYIGEFNFFGGPEGSEYGLYFNIAGTLFCPSSLFYGDNRELYSLNHPLLSHALRLWEKKLGSINEIQGLGVYEYGFLPEI